MDFGFPNGVIIVWLVTLILILPVANRIRKVLVEHVTYFQTPLVSWYRKKHVLDAFSIVEAEYVASSSFCAQIL